MTFSNRYWNWLSLLHPALGRLFSCFVLCPWVASCTGKKANTDRSYSLHDIKIKTDRFSSFQQYFTSIPQFSFPSHYCPLMWALTRMACRNRQTNLFLSHSSIHITTNQTLPHTCLLRHVLTPVRLLLTVLLKWLCRHLTFR